MGTKQKIKMRKNINLKGLLKELYINELNVTINIG